MEIKCDKCGAVHDTVEPETVWDGEIEHTFFRCPNCDAVYPISATESRYRGIQPQATADPHKAGDGAVPPGDGGAKTGKPETM